jgi:uncharacterized membrane protein
MITKNIEINVLVQKLIQPLLTVPTFYAFLSVMPSMVVFVVSIETSFYEKYRTFTIYFINP